MKIMTGIDLRSNNALCRLMDENGWRVLHKKLPCELPVILQLIEPYKAQIAQAAYAFLHEIEFLNLGTLWAPSMSKCARSCSVTAFIIYNRRSIQHDAIATGEIPRQVHFKTK